jgi:hypothetical protein
LTTTMDLPSLLTMVIRNCTISSRYSVGIQWHYTCRRQVVNLLMRNINQRALCVSKSTP